MRQRLSQFSVLMLGLLALGACATVPPPPPPPAGEVMARPPGSPARPPSAPGVNKQQYLDQKTGQYYYFDPVRGAYFWEDGRPRG